MLVNNMFFCVGGVGGSVLLEEVSDDSADAQS